MTPLLVLLQLVLLSSVAIGLVRSYPDPVPMLFPDCERGPLSSFPICRPSLPAAQRVTDLLSRMTVAEKFAWMGNSVPAVPRLGLPAYQWWEEALHGVAFSPGPTFDALTPFSTQYPMPLGLAQSFNRSLWRTVGQRIADEARAFTNVNRSGFDYWTPNINIFRDPRWGRGRETPGEDPYLSSQYLRVLIAGLQQGEDQRYIKVLATCKHYTAYDMEASDGVDRFSFDARVSDVDLQETYQVPFQACVEAGVLSFMCAFNAVNGVPMCANSYEIEEILRGQWGFEGYITSDCGGVDNLYSGHHYVADDLHAVPAALHGGCDLDCGGVYQSVGAQAVQAGLVTETEVDRALGRAFTGLLRTGWFDPPADQYYRSIGIDHINTEANQRLAMEAAQQSIVLLKNDRGLLPLQLPLTLAVIGPNANSTDALWVSYAGPAPYFLTPLLSAQDYGGGLLKVLYAPGCDVNTNDTSGFAAAVAAAKAADAVLFVGGNSNDQEGEYQDRASLELPGQQWQLVMALEKASKRPIIVTLLSSGPIDLSYARQSPTVGAIISLGVPGQSGGAALMSALFGEYNPSGRLTMTHYPAAYAQQVQVTNMNMRPGPNNPGRTYKFYTGQPVYEFGYGLSYTNFSYTPIDVVSDAALHLDIDALRARLSTASAKAADAPLLSYHVNVTNTGRVAGAVSVLSFLSANASSLVGASPTLSPPIRELVGFDRLLLEAGETGRADFVMTVASFRTVRDDGSAWLLPGAYSLFLQHDCQCQRTVQLTGRPWQFSAGRKDAKEAYARMLSSAGHADAPTQGEAPSNETKVATS